MHLKQSVPHATLIPEITSHTGNNKFVKWPDKPPRNVPKQPCNAIICITHSLCFFPINWIGHNPSSTFLLNKTYTRYIYLKCNKTPRNPQSPSWQFESFEKKHGNKTDFMLGVYFDFTNAQRACSSFLEITWISLLFAIRRFTVKAKRHTVKFKIM